MSLLGWVYEYYYFCNSQELSLTVIARSFFSIQDIRIWTYFNHFRYPNQQSDVWHMRRYSNQQSDLWHMRPQIMKFLWVYISFTIIRSFFSIQDKFAEHFVNAIWEQKENPVIIILAACRVQLWNSEYTTESFKGCVNWTDFNRLHFSLDITDEPRLGNVWGTKFYLNYNHHSVNHLRRM